MSSFRIITALAVACALAGCAAKGAPKAVKLEGSAKRDPYYRFVRADLLSMDGETKKSTAELKKLIEDEPGVAYHHYILAQNYALEGRLPAATAASLDAVEIDPDFIRA